jgi:hypothetical protein
VLLVIDCAVAEVGWLVLVEGMSGVKVVRRLASHIRTCPFLVGDMAARKSGGIGDVAAHCTLRKDPVRAAADCGGWVGHLECAIEAEATALGMVAGIAVGVLVEDSLLVLGHLCISQYLSLTLVRAKPTWCVVAIRWGGATITI